MSFVSTGSSNCNSGAGGKTTLSRSVAWINGLSVFQIKVHNKYTPDDFDDDLHTVPRQSGCHDEKIIFIMDESNVLDLGFLERMNTLLANGEVPGLFEANEFTTLMTQCKEGSQKEGLMLDSSEDTHQIMRNLHVVFTTNPSSEGLKDKAATSPALFNSCVLNWFGDWSTDALYQVGYEFTNKVDLDKLDVKLYNKKRQDLEEQQLHLNVRLQKIRETVEQVENLQASLFVKKNELEQKNTLANQKLKQMVHSQQGREEEDKVTGNCSSASNSTVPSPVVVEEVVTTMHNEIIDFILIEDGDD
uniref:Dynein heavy chain AAA module D4 domain-containing protein n=1 Tax=Amphimedon queenslandica TaxID=400682 RepID=A0A1X7SUP6_AMPQE